MTIQSITAGHEPGGLSLEAAAAYRFTKELVETRSVGDRHYSAAVDALGIQGVADAVNLIGIYLATSVLLNTFEVPAPSEQHADTERPEHSGRTRKAERLGGGMEGAP